MPAARLPVDRRARLPARRHRGHGDGRPAGAGGRYEQATYEGGRTKGTLRIGNLVARPQVFTLALESDGVSVERFLGDLDLPGTGLSGTAALGVTLRWGEGGIGKANGGGAIRIKPGPPTSLVKGRFGIPISGGGPLSVVDGRIGFEGTTFRFVQTTLDASGGIQIGHWQPDFDVRIKSRDLEEVDRLFQNFVGRRDDKPEPLGAGGTGEAFGHWPAAGGIRSHLCRSRRRRRAGAACSSAARAGRWESRMERFSSGRSASMTARRPSPWKGRFAFGRRPRSRSSTSPPRHAAIRVPPGAQVPRLPVSRRRARHRQLSDRGHG